MIKGIKKYWKRVVGWIVSFVLTFYFIGSYGHKKQVKGYIQGYVHGEEFIVELLDSCLSNMDSTKYDFTILIIGEVDTFRIRQKSIDSIHEEEMYIEN